MLSSLVHAPLASRSVVQYDPSWSSLPIGDTWESAGKAKLGIKVRSRGRHHDNTSNNDIGWSRGSEVRNDPLARAFFIRFAMSL